MPRMINKNNKETLQNFDAEAGSNNNEPSKRLKKGPWTATEDAILMEYVKKQGEGNWNSIQKNSGLARCGKSCRLRWANHLRPNLKKGSFTPEEERIIIELHAKLGNKWARMAAQLPGRTDNEIKNYWNTRMKRRQRAGLPVYPHDVQQEAIAYQLQQEQQQWQITSSASFSSAIFSASQLSNLTYNTPVQGGDQLSFASFSNNLQNPTRFNMYSQQKNQFKVFSESTNHGGLVKKPVSPVSPYDESSSSTAFNQGTCQSIPSHSHDHNSSSGNPFSLSFSAMLMGVGPYETVGVMSAKETEVPSIQTPSLSVTPTSSYTHSGEGFVAASAHASDYKLAPVLSSQENNGLLGDLVLQSQGLSGSSSSRSDDQNLSEKGKTVVADESLEEEDALIPKDSETHPSDSRRDENFCSPPSSTEKKPVMDDPLGEMNSMDDDLLCLLTNFPSCMPLPEWYRRGEGQTSMITTDQKVQLESTDSEHNASPAPSKEHTSALAS